MQHQLLRPEPRRSNSERNKPDDVSRADHEHVKRREEHRDQKQLGKKRDKLTVPIDDLVDTPYLFYIDLFPTRLIRLAHNLSPTELRVATLLRQNKSSCEIAKELKMTEHSVGNYRTRLRKKLKLEDEMCLETFLSCL
jgi:DNA-binding NarL/FixJ family response regulator